MQIYIKIITLVVFYILNKVNVSRVLPFFSCKTFGGMKNSAYFCGRK